VKEIECVVHCPSCNEVKFTVFRVPTGNEGVFTNVTEPPEAFAIRCQCGAVLERKL